MLSFGHADSPLKKILCCGFDIKKDIYNNCKNKCTSIVDKICENNEKDIVSYSLHSFKNDKNKNEIIGDMRRCFGFENLRDITDAQIKLYVKYKNNLMFSNLNDWIKTFVNNLDAIIIVEIKSSVSAKLLPKGNKDDYEIIGTYRDVMEACFSIRIN